MKQDYVGFRPWPKTQLGQGNIVGWIDLPEAEKPNIEITDRNPTWLKRLDDMVYI